MTPQETARAILALYDGKPERWTQHSEARDVAGDDVTPLDGDAVCWCVFGAIQKVSKTVRWTDAVSFPLTKALDQELGGESWPEDWNDAPERTFADVVALLEKIAAEPTP